MSRRTEAGMGLAVAALTLIAIGLAVFAPAVYTYGTAWITAGSTSLLEAGITANVGIYLAAMIAAALGIGAGAYLCSRELRSTGLTLLWVSTLALCIGSLLTLPGWDTAVVPNQLHTDSPDSVGIGIYLIVPALVALATAVTDTLFHVAPHRPITLRPH